jgi:hypothetical protein
MGGEPLRPGPEPHSGRTEAYALPLLTRDPVSMGLHTRPAANHKKDRLGFVVDSPIPPHRYRCL